MLHNGILSVPHTLMAVALAWTSSCLLDIDNPYVDDRYTCVTVRDCVSGYKCVDGLCTNQRPSVTGDAPPTPVCANGHTEVGEQCDDGNRVDGDGCDSNCSPTACGNGIVGPPEACDDGPLNGIAEWCDLSCGGTTPTSCGNGALDAGEECDDGANRDSCDGCLDDCTSISNTCGDGYVCGTETCDSGQYNDKPNMCDSTCAGITPAVCGNGVREATETCDDANIDPCDGCLDDCRSISNTCGDGYVCGTETCDSGQYNGKPNGCDSTCAGITPAVCGNGVREATEACDDANTDPCDGCLDDCTSINNSCGDGHVCGREVCDDGDVLDGNGCDTNCLLTGCGNRVVTSGEGCDDGINDGSHGCFVCRIVVEPVVALGGSIRATETSVTVGVRLGRVGEPSALRMGACIGRAPSPERDASDSSCADVAADSTSDVAILVYGLLPATAYYVRPFAVTVLGVSYGGVISTTTAPSAPTAPHVTASAHSVALSWTASAGASSYRIFRDGALLADAVTGMTFEDLAASAWTVAAPPMYATPGDESSPTDRVMIQWLHASVSPSVRHTYEIQAVSPWAESTGRLQVEGQRADPVIGYELRINGGIWLSLAAEARSYDDVAASSVLHPVVAGGQAQATDGSSNDAVMLQLEGQSASATGTNYELRAKTAGGEAPISQSTGSRRIAMSYQWERTSGDADNLDSYAAISGATTAEYSDTTAPADGASRYFRCRVCIVGLPGKCIYSSSDVGFRNHQTKLLVDGVSAGDGFGLSIAAANNYVLVGAPGHPRSRSFADAGSVHVFERDSTNTWAHEAKLSASDLTSLDRFGTSVAALDAFAIVGAPGADNQVPDSNVGAVYVFQREAADLWPERFKLVATDGAADDQFGVAVALSDEYAFVGAPAADVISNTGTNCIDGGAVYVFRREAEGPWLQLVQKLTADSCGSTAWFGYSVSVSGAYAIVGSAGDDTLGPDAGAAYVFERDENGQWLKVAKLTSNDDSQNFYFGLSVSISGSRAIVGSPGLDIGGVGSLVGGAYIFKRLSNGTWQLQPPYLSPMDRAPEDLFGDEVVISGDTAVITAIGDDELGAQSGSVYVCARDDGSSASAGDDDLWIQMDKHSAVDGIGGAAFGSSIAVSGPDLFVGAPGDGGTVSGPGAAYAIRMAE